MISRREFSPSWQFALVVLMLIGAAILQSGLANAIAIKGAKPDFLLIVLACSASLLGGSRSVYTGFLAGVLTAALIPKTFGTYLASRTIGGGLCGLLNRFMLKDSLIVPPLIVGLTTLTVEIVAFFMAPDTSFSYHQLVHSHAPDMHDIKLRALLMGKETLYNVLLAHPIYALLRWLGIGYEPEDPFGLIS